MKETMRIWVGTTSLPQTRQYHYWVYFPVDTQLMQTHNVNDIFLLASLLQSLPSSCRGAQKKSGWSRAIKERRDGCLPISASLINIIILFHQKQCAKTLEFSVEISFAFSVLAHLPRPFWTQRADYSNIQEFANSVFYWLIIMMYSASNFFQQEIKTPVIIGNIPSSIWAAIFAQAPASALIRCRRVSKSFSSMPHKQASHVLSILLRISNICCRDTGKRGILCGVVCVMFRF